MKEFKGTPGPWTIRGKNYDQNGGFVYPVAGVTGEMILWSTDPIVYAEPTIFSIHTKESFRHAGNFENKEETTGFYNRSDLPIDANASLIAAAPELLEALQELMATYEKDKHLLNFNVDTVRKAIDKALGLSIPQLTK